MSAEEKAKRADRSVWMRAKQRTRGEDWKGPIASRWTSKNYYESVTDMIMDLVHKFWREKNRFPNVFDIEESFLIYATKPVEFTDECLERVVHECSVLLLEAFEEMSYEDWTPSSEQVLKVKEGVRKFAKANIKEAGLGFLEDEDHALTVDRSTINGVICAMRALKAREDLNTELNQERRLRSPDRVSDSA